MLYKKKVKLVGIPQLLFGIGGVHYETTSVI
jgi:hypothetical protein